MNRLKYLRLLRGVTADTLAKEIGISRAALTVYENGEVLDPREDNKRKIEDYFGESYEALMSTCNQFDTRNKCIFNKDGSITRLKYLRKERGLTIREVCEIIGVSQPVLSRYEAGSRTPRDYRVRLKFEELFGESWESLMSPYILPYNTSTEMEGSISSDTFEEIAQLREVISYQDKRISELEARVSKLEGNHA